MSTPKPAPRRGSGRNRSIAIGIVIALIAAIAAALYGATQSDATTTGAAPKPATVQLHELAARNA
jgi:hypothetical protein